MIKYTPSSEITLKLFKNPFEQQLSPSNRWVQMAGLIPWDEMASVFFESLDANMGRGSIDLRVVLGVLFVQHIEELSDQRVISYVQENIYAQYFVGLPSFQTDAVFDPSLLVTIRKRLGKEGVVKLNDFLLKHAVRKEAIKHDPPKKKKGNSNTKETQEETEENTTQSTDKESIENKGTLKADASVAPQNIKYPTDVSLLAEARIKLECLIDKLYIGSKLWPNKPRTYRKEAAKAYLNYSKKRSKSSKDIRLQRKKQLNYVKRNLSIVESMLDEKEKHQEQIAWQHKDWRLLWILQELFRQQWVMFTTRTKKIEERIVSISQPYVRPIIRKKDNAKTEFGAKINVSETEGFVRMDQADFNNFNEGINLIEQIECFKGLYNHFPELVLVDKIYLNRENRNYLKVNNIRHAGVPLGRKPNWTTLQKRERKKENDKRATIEGKFGQGKTRYGLDKIRTKTEQTSYACIGLILLAMNLVRLRKVLLFSFFERVVSTLGEHMQWLYEKTLPKNKLSKNCLYSQARNLNYLQIRA